MKKYDLQDVRDHIATGVCPQAWALETLDQAINLMPELVATLNKLERWSSTFIEDTPLSAETIWREFPQAIKEARATLAKAKPPVREGASNA